MANGEVVAPQYMHEFKVFKLLDAAGATTSGAWVDTRVYGDKAVLHIAGITTATVQIYGSNADTQPADATDGVQIGSDLTADGLWDLGTLPCFVKAKVSAHTTATIIANLKAYRPV